MPPPTPPALCLVTDGPPLRQTLIALTSGTVLQEHNSPPAASIQVLAGAVTRRPGMRSHGD